MRPENTSRVRFMPFLILSNSPIRNLPFPDQTASFSMTETVFEMPFSSITTP